MFLFSVKPENVQLLTNITANKTCPGDYWNFTCLVGPANPDKITYQLLGNDTVVDSDSSGMWIRLLSSSGVFSYKCLANNTVGTTISETGKNITVAGNNCVSILQFMPSNITFRLQEIVKIQMDTENAPPSPEHARLFIISHFSI